jgi:hypothetical protein
MWLDNQPREKIAEALGRSIPAIMTRAVRLGLPRRIAPGRKSMATPAEQEQKRAEEKERKKKKLSLPAAQTVSRIQPKKGLTESTPPMSLRICLMCLRKFESAGPQNRICTSCKNSSEYSSAGELPEINLPTM